MPIIKSAKKRVKIAAKARARNVKTKRGLREALKAFSKAVDSGKPTDIATAQQAVTRELDRAVKKNILHKNKAARQKSDLSARAKAAGVKPSKAAAKKAPAKPAVKKAPVKKTTPKKAAAKKTAK
ncbi:MAG TPA: 30S ribosomal protein S20 [Candidatus Saccharimonadales bacterium]|nr:30S ribosomal protein S20 [Candidatus Saccharimonadales bacterium]